MNTNEVARIALLVGEPARTSMLIALMDGRSLTANELARAAHITAPTCSRHLAQLVEAKLLLLEQRGRHRYHRLASPEVAKVLEGIMQLAVSARASRSTIAVGPKDLALRAARTCYDHLAGRLGVAIAQRLLDDGAIVFDGDAGQLTDKAQRALDRLGIAAAALDAGARKTRPDCRPCLDWSERKPHVAGRLGALICAHCLDRRWLTRRAGSRALDITAGGTLALQNWLGAERWRNAVEQPTRRSG